MAMDAPRNPLTRKEFAAKARQLELLEGVMDAIRTEHPSLDDATLKIAAQAVVTLRKLNMNVSSWCSISNKMS